MKNYNSNRNLIDNDVKKHFKIKRGNDDKTAIAVPLFDHLGKKIMAIRGILDTACNLRDIQSVQPSGSKNVLRWSPVIDLIYHLNSIPLASDNLILTFDIPQVWLLWKYGFPRSIGVLGDGMTQKQILRVRYFLSERATIWVLTDAFGRSFINGSRLARRLSTMWETHHICKAHRKVMDLSPQDMLKLFAPH